MSIFIQDCPDCGMTNSASTDVCECGHIFTATTDSLGAIKMASQEEEAYEAYLAARLDQARLAAEKAIELLTQDPTDAVKVSQAKQANRELSQINSEYEQQLTSAEMAQAEAKRARAEAALRQARLAAESAASLQDLHENNRAEKPEASPAEQAATSPFNPPKIVSLSSPAVSAARRHEPRTSQPSARPARAVTRARTGDVRRETSAAIQARRVAQQMIAQKAQAIADRKNMPKRMASSVAKHAERVNTVARNAMKSVSGDLAAAANALDSRLTHFNSPSIIRRETRSCPVCAAEMPGNASSCKCGYEISSGATTMPGLSVDGDLG